MRGMYEEDDLLKVLNQNLLWDKLDEEALAKTSIDEEAVKVKLYELFSRPTEREGCRRLLENVRTKRAELAGRKGTYDHMTCAAHAGMARLRFLMGRCLMTQQGTPVWQGSSFWHDDSALLDGALAASMDGRLSEAQVRLVARTEPWRSLWSCREACGCFLPGPASDMTDEQRSVVVWSKIYDGAAENPEGPPDALMEDDDAFDGYLISSRNKRGQEQGKRKTPDRISNADEVFIMAKDREEAKSIEEMNDEGAKRIKAMRNRHLQKHGAVLEAQMPDSKMKIRQQFMEMRKS